MLVLAHGFNLFDVFGVAYFASAPGLLMYGVAVVWAFSHTGWRRKIRAGVAITWGVVFPLVYVTMMIAGGAIHERLVLSIAMVICSGVSGVVLWMASGNPGPAKGCAVGCALAVLMFLLLSGEADWSPLGFMVLSAVWGAPVLIAMVIWARDEVRLRRSGNACGACGYDLQGLAGAVCPECGGMARGGPGV
ncbi:MAG: hypothetical protein QM783_20125 [Phycisphaerales bacterium]